MNIEKISDGSIKRKMAFYCYLQRMNPNRLFRHFKSLKSNRNWIRENERDVEELKITIHHQRSLPLKKKLQNIIDFQENNKKTEVYLDRKKTRKTPRYDEENVEDPEN